MEEKEIGSRGTFIPGGPPWIHQWNDKDKTEVDLRIARPRGYPEYFWALALTEPEKNSQYNMVGMDIDLDPFR